MMMTISRLTAAMAVVLALCATGRADLDPVTAALPQGVPAYPGLITVSQPDGTVFEARLFGDERYHWMETSDGYVVDLNRETGFYEYVRVGEKGRYELTGLVVGRDDPAAGGLVKYARESREVIAEKRLGISDERIRQAVGSFRRELFPTSGTIPLLVILVNFNDTTTTVLPSDFEALFNGDPETSPELTGSVWHYYKEVSYGAVDLRATIVGWINVSGARADYGDPDSNARDLVKEAINLLFLNGFDFSPFDVDGDGYLEPIVVIHSGEGEEVTGDPLDIWSHQWGFYPPTYSPPGYDVDTSGTTPGALGLRALDYTIQPELQFGLPVTIGVICHELGHAFGLIDLYDTVTGDSVVGEWALMDGGAWNGIERPGDSPAHLCAWSKMYLGWLQPTPENDLVITTPRLGAALPPVETQPFAFLIPMDDPEWPWEYLLLENRQWVGYDQALPSTGMLVWHVDDLMFDNTLALQEHRRVVLLQADGRNDIENLRNRGDDSDPFPGSLNVREIGPWSECDAKYYRPNTNGYIWEPLDTGDRNIWLLNIVAADQFVFTDIRFLPNLSFDETSSVPLRPLHPPIVFKNGTTRDFFVPGDPLVFDINIFNRDDNFPYAWLCEDSPPFWLEFWGSFVNGLTFDYSLTDSVRVEPGVPGNDLLHVSGANALYSIPEGSYTLMASIDRLREVKESGKIDNRWQIPGPRLLVLRSMAVCDLAIRDFSFGPQWAKAGDTIQLGGRIVNEGQAPSGPFWVEVWGSFDSPTKYYPTLDFFVCDSIRIDNIPPGGAVDLSAYSRTLYAVPPHAVEQPFKVGCFVDRADQVNETDETNNYQFVGPIYFSTLAGTPPPEKLLKRLGAGRLAPPPPRPTVELGREQIDKAELCVFWTTTTLSGQQPPLYLQADLTIKNWGPTTAPASWAHVYVSRDPFLSPDDYLWIAGIRLPPLPPGASWTTAAVTGPPDLPLGAYCMLAQCDVLDEVDEQFEDNNVYYAGPILVGPDLTVDLYDFQELDPTYLPALALKFCEPGSSVSLAVRISNNGVIPAGPFWLEFWGSRLGGLTLDDFLFNSEMLSGVWALSSVDLFFYKRLNSVGDGAYTVMAVVDRPNDVVEVYEGNNRRPVAGKRLLHIRPIRPINLRIPVFRFAPQVIRPGELIKWNGSVVNDGPEHSGPFWIEVFGSTDIEMPVPMFQLCDSILVENLRPGQQFFFQPYQRRLYENVPTGRIAVICVVDRLDQIPEYEESDNFRFTHNIIIAEP